MVAALLLLGAALLSLVLLLRTPAVVDSYLAGREAHAAHLVMNGTMAAMAWPALPAAGWPAILAVLAAGSALLAGRAGLALWHGAGERAAGSLYHLAGMAIMALLTPGMAAMARSGMAGGHGMAMAGPPPSWPALLAAVLFALDGLATLLLAVLRPGLLVAMQRRTPGAGPPAAPADLRWSAVPHLAMDAAMVAMLL